MHSFRDMGAQEKGRITSALIKGLTRLNLAFADPSGVVRFRPEGKTVGMPVRLHTALNVAYAIGLGLLDCG